MQETTERSPERVETDDQKQEGVKVLMAEDNLVNQKLAGFLFNKLNCKIDMVSNGREAVEAVVNGSYQLVFMDIQMPILDGVEASREIREQLGENSPAIVALTAHAMQGDKEKYLDAGMDHYIAKPISLHDLEGCINRFVNS